MNIQLILLIQSFNHTCFRGSKILMTLYAIELGASPFTIGLLFAMFSIFPTFVSVAAGKVSDKVGFRAPMLFGTVGLLIGMLLPSLMPALSTLFVSATIIGTCYIFYTVSVQHLIGSLAEGVERTRNYSWYSLCVGLTALTGPVMVGFAVEWVGLTLHPGAPLERVAPPHLSTVAFRLVRHDGEPLADWNARNAALKAAGALD